MSGDGRSARADGDMASLSSCANVSAIGGFVEDRSVPLVEEVLCGRF